MTHIRTEQLTKTYTQTEQAFDALRDVELKINRGDLIGIVGKSGSGKSTLMNMLSGIDQPTKGRVLVNNKLISSMTESQLAKWRGNNVGVVFQFFQLMPTLTILENILLPMSFTKTIPKRERVERAKSLLSQVGILDQMNKFPSTLSGGQQQRAAIARALANDPHLIIADEPTGNLDSKTAQQIMTLFQDLAAQGKTVIIVSHDQDMTTYCDRIIRIKDGQVENTQSKGRVHYG